MRPTSSSRIPEFLAFVEEYGDGWTVLFREVAASRPLAEEVATLRGRIADATGRMIDAVVGAGAGLTPAASDAIAHAIVGAGESLANWWLAHPEVDRDQVADWYVQIVRGAVTAAMRSGPR
jgi:AcrR family transcriptional regulator